MAQKTICDICKRDITNVNMNFGAEYKGFQFSVDPLPTDVCPAQTPDICRHCIIDAFIASDDRPKETECRPADPLPWQVCASIRSVPIACFAREGDAMLFVDSLSRGDGAYLVIERI